MLNELFDNYISYYELILSPYHERHDLNASDIDSFVDRFLVCNDF